MLTYAPTSTSSFSNMLFLQDAASPAEWLILLCARLAWHCHLAQFACEYKSADTDR
jgi:hypothetical protein